MVIANDGGGFDVGNGGNEDGVNDGEFDGNTTSVEDGNVLFGTLTSIGAFVLLWEEAAGAGVMVGVEVLVGVIDGLEAVLGLDDDESVDFVMGVTVDVAGGCDGDTVGKDDGVGDKVGAGATRKKRGCEFENVTCVVAVVVVAVTVSWAPITATDIATNKKVERAPLEVMDTNDKVFITAKVVVASLNAERSQRMERFVMFSVDTPLAGHSHRDKRAGSYIICIGLFGQKSES